MEKKNISVKVWLFLIGSILCLGIGIVLLAQYGIEVSDIKSVITEESNKTSWYIDYKMNDIHGETWVTIHKTYSKVLIVIGIILLNVFIIQLLKCIEGEEFAGILKLPSIGVVVGCLICWRGCSIMVTSEAERSMYHGQDDPRSYVGLCLIIGIGIVWFAIYMASKAISRYRLAKYNPEEYKKLVEKEKAKAQAKAEAMEKAQAMKPECPYCHSHNTSKITTTAKVINTAMFGVLGQKRKYQWHCNNCKSDF